MQVIFQQDILSFHSQQSLIYYPSTICIDDIFVSIHTSHVVDHGNKPWSCQTKDYKSGSCCFSAKQAALRRKSKDRLAQNQDIVSRCSDMSTHRLVSVNLHYKNTTKGVSLVQSRHHYHLLNFLQCLIRCLMGMFFNRSSAFGYQL